MTNEEKAIGRAIAEHLGMRGGRLATDVGTVEPFLPPCRGPGHVLAVRMDDDVWDVEVTVTRRPRG